MNEEQINKEHTSPMERLYLGTFVVPTDAGLEVFGAIAVDADTGRITRTIEHRATAERLVDKSPTSFVVSELPSGCIALPAFHDGHIHALSSAVRRLFGIDLSECGSWEAAAAQLLTKYPTPAMCAFDERRCDAAERRNWVRCSNALTDHQNRPDRSQAAHATEKCEARHGRRMHATHNRSSEVDGSGAGFRRVLRFSVKPWMRYSARTGCSCRAGCNTPCSTLRSFCSGRYVYLREADGHCVWCGAARSHMRTRMSPSTHTTPKPPTSTPRTTRRPSPKP